MKGNQTQKSAKHWDDNPKTVIMDGADPRTEAHEGKWHA